MDVGFTRTLRTPSSERYILRVGSEADAAALELHFLDDRSVSGTLILLSERLADPAVVEKLLSQIDEALLPLASLDDKSLTFTVVSGRVEGNFVPSAIH